jgi:type IV secretion system protein VirB2
MKKIEISKNVGVSEAAKNLAILAVLVFLCSHPAMAQIEAATSVMNMLKTTLVAVAVVVVTCAIMWAGFKMIFQAAGFKDVANIFIGAIFIGGAAAIAALLVPAAG